MLSKRIKKQFDYVRDFWSSLYNELYVDTCKKVEHNWEDPISAEEAKEVTEIVRNNKYNDTRRFLFREINRAAFSGIDSYTDLNKLPKLFIKELESLGYKVDAGKDYTRISWG